MMYRTHIAAGMISGLVLAGQSPTDKTLMFGIVAGVAALLPDIDHPNSIMGRCVPFLSWLVKFTAGHRGPLHSLLGAFVVTTLIGATCLYFYPLKFVFEYLIPPLAAGYISHILLDALNGKGVALFYPARISVGLPLFQTGGLMERLVLFPALAIICGSILLTMVPSLI